MSRIAKRSLNMYMIYTKEHTITWEMPFMFILNYYFRNISYDNKSCAIFSGKLNPRFYCRCSSLKLMFWHFSCETFQLPAPNIPYPIFRTLKLVVKNVFITLAFVMITMMTSSNVNLFRVTGLLCGEFTSRRWIPHTKTSDAELRCFLWSSPELKVE